MNQSTVPNKNIHENHMNKDINEEEEEEKKQSWYLVYFTKKKISISNYTIKSAITSTRNSILFSKFFGTERTKQETNARKHNNRRFIIINYYDHKLRLQCIPLTSRGTYN